jgi:hypothetical protein
MRWMAWLAVWLAACTVGDPKDPVDTDDDTPSSLDDDRDGVNNAQDCDDNNPNVFPGARELCDGVDNDCDDKTDDEDDSLDRSTATEYFVDDDEDGFGAESKGYFCEQPRRGSLISGDCDDADGANFPDNPEICDDRDNDCDELIDDEDPTLALSSASTWFADDDGDGFGDPTAQVRVCEQPDDAVTNALDCDDADPRKWSTKPEECNGYDDNCDGLLDAEDPSVDPTSLVTVYADADSDSYGDPGTPAAVCSPIPGYVANDDDCNDASSDDFPGAPEVCDGRDNNCDALGLVDDADPAIDPGTTPRWYADVDRDTYGDPTSSRLACVRPSGFVANTSDCNDREPLAWTANPEVCDGVDNDCRGGTDEADPSINPALLTTFFDDDDGDDRGDPAEPRLACFLPADAALLPDDCNDAERRAWTGRAETCDGVDNDCDGGVDLDAVDGTEWYLDLDGDGRGDPSTLAVLCTQPSGGVTNGDDCDDTEPLAWTGRRERCDGADNDCNGLTDEADPGVDLASGDYYYVDRDGDTYGDPTTERFSCTPIAGRVTSDGDCNDNEPRAWTGRTEICDGVDNDCRAGVDDADPGLDLRSATQYWPDVDGDGYGSASASVRRCVQPPGTVTNGGDCNDGDPLAWTGAPEVCDGSDNDCDGRTDDADSSLDPSGLQSFWRDADGDGYGDPARGVLRCFIVSGIVPNDDDCNDAQPLAWTGKQEVCDGVDNDCDALTDSADPSLDASTTRQWYLDADGDGFGDPTQGALSCSPPPGRVGNPLDCDDGEPTAWTGAPDLCDGIDNDCDLLLDDADPDYDDWWNTAWPYRVLVEVTGPDTAMPAAPIAVDVDFPDLLADVGDLTRLRPSTVRVVNQRCDLGQPEVPSEFADDLWGVFDKVDIDDAVGDFAGSVLFVYDEDGDLGTSESLAPGESATFAIYFGSLGTTPAVPAPTYPSGLGAFTNGVQAELSNDRVIATFDRATGGVATSLGVVGGDGRVGSQSTTLLGNGLFMNTPGASAGGQWIVARDPAATLSVVHSGPVFAAVRTEGAASGANGGFRYRYTYMLFEGRPEVYAKVEMIIDRPTHLGPLSTSWTSAVRPWLTDNNAVIAATTGQEGARDTPGFNWVRGAYDTSTASPFGVVAGYRAGPLARVAPVWATNGRWIGLPGQDYVATTTANEVDLTAGAVVLDNTIVAVLPHEGPYSAVSDELLGILQGAEAVVGVAEAF